MKKSYKISSKSITPAPAGIYTPGVVGIDGEPYHDPSGGRSSLECGIYGEHETGNNIPIEKPKVKPKPYGLGMTSPVYQDALDLKDGKSTKLLPEARLNHPNANISQNGNHLYDMAAETEETSNRLSVPFSSFRARNLKTEQNGSHMYDRAADFQEREDYVKMSALSNGHETADRNENRIYDMANQVSATSNNEDGDDFSDDFSDEEQYDDVDDEHIYEDLETFQYLGDAAAQQHGAQSNGDNSQNKGSSALTNIVKEFVFTEKNFLRDLDIIINDIMQPLAQRQLPEGVRLETIFGNIEAVRDFSASFLASLNASVEGSSYENADIARVFMDHAEKMKEVYKIYCRNNDDSNALLQKYRNVPQFRVPVAECLSNAKDKVNVCGLGSLLIKPVQRVLKYPLLLKELLKNSPQPHPGEDTTHYKELIEANKIANDIATAINQAKRGKDLVKRYRSKGAGDWQRSSGHFIHGLRKKTKRLSTKMSQAINKPKIVDKAFDTVEQNFKSLGFAVASFLENCDYFIKDYEELLNSDLSCAEALLDFCAPEQNRPLMSYVSAAKKIINYFFVQFRTNFQQRIIEPLTVLDQQLKEPHSIIAKRADKLLDYENSLNTSDTKENTQMAKNVYEALNQQLLDDIPKLSDLAYKLLDVCLWELIQMQISFLKDSLEVLDESLQLCKGEDASVDHLEKMLIMKHFNSVQEQMLLRMKSFTIIPESITERVNSSYRGYNMMDGSSPVARKRSSTAQQPEQHREHLLKQYQPSDLYVAVSDYWSPNNTDLSCSLDELIGVIKRQDPSGNNNVWFCDNGVVQGFIPSSMLQSYTAVSPAFNRRTWSQSSAVQYYGYYSRAAHPQWSQSSQKCSNPQRSPSSQRDPSAQPPPSPRPSPYSLREGLYGEVEDPTHVYDKVPAEVMDTLYDAEDEMLDDTEYGTLGKTSPSKTYRYRVLFSHKARSAIELSITKGDLVNVLLQHDKDGCTDWWLVADKTGKQGFVPYNFIGKIE